MLGALWRMLSRKSVISRAAISGPFLSIMAHHSARLPACANCGYAFPPETPDTYCPRCGQHNQALDLSAGHVLEETLEGVFHFDGKVFRTARLLLLRPGELTRKFLEGRRVPYVPPIRLYVFVSFIFFFLLSLSMHPARTGRTIGQQMQQASRKLYVDSVRLARTEPDTAVRRATLQPQRRLLIVNGIVQIENSSDTMAYRRWFKGMMLAPAEQARLATLSAPQLDSVLRRYGQASSMKNRFILRQGSRVLQSTDQEVSHRFVRGVSFMMFLLMPLFALLLKVLYFWARRYYLGHLIFSLHLHTVAFLLLGLNIVLVHMLHLPSSVLFWLLAALLVYLALALRRVYAQPWWKTLLKTLLLGATYTLAIMGFLLGTLVLSFALV